ncbi:hypothetical protein ONZ51_g5133 [Trametes cubensis]|uniref:Uncharacterized protein n=1 Tax=Trametes cubensis TaxID=1111947 RepID=A0AAD7TUK3_9APHY|nr:hypothetical protein ONZ51_g5133 [Trametes cubensis]
MLFPSTHDSNLKTQQDLIVFCYAQERVLIPLPKTYEDARNRARDVFGIADDVVFETTDLYGSDGMRVRIHSTAWEGVSPILHTVPDPGHGWEPFFRRATICQRVEDAAQATWEPYALVDDQLRQRY